MKPFLSLKIWLAWLVLTAGLATPLALAQSGGDYELTQTVISTGGGEISGGDYSLTSVIGQPVAGTVISGGDYSLTGGFLDAGAPAESHLPIYLPIVVKGNNK